MREKKFTAGPWNNKCASSVEIGNDWWHADNQTLSTSEISKRSLTREANAHLISAAPELLEALESALNLLKGYNDPEYQSGFSVIVKSEAAISRAYGEVK